MTKKEFNEKIADDIADILGNVLHDDSAEYVDETQITNDLCRRFQVTEWEQRHVISNVVNTIVTARPAIWHIMVRIIKQKNSVSVKVRELTYEEKEEGK